MKLNKKKVVVSALAVSLVAILSFGTIAWFSAEDTIENKFHFADSDDDGNTDFSVDVVESNDLEADGLVFEEILPGDTYDKDPTIKNTSTSDRYSQYIRATLTLKDPTGTLKKAFDEGRIGGGKMIMTNRAVGLLDEMFQKVDCSNNGDWTLAGSEGTGYGYDEEAKEFYWVFYYKETLGKDQEVKLFEKVTIPTGLTVADANAMQSTFDVTVKAEAVQAESLNLTYASPSNAFKAVGMELEAR